MAEVKNGKEIPCKSMRKGFGFPVNTSATASSFKSNAPKSAGISLVTSVLIKAVDALVAKNDVRKKEYSLMWVRGKVKLGKKRRSSIVVADITACVPRKKRIILETIWYKNLMIPLLMPILSYLYCKWQDYKWQVA